MSSKHNALFVYGLHLDRETLGNMYADYFDDDRPTPLIEMLISLYEAGLIDYESNFTGEAFPLDLAGRPCWGNVLESYHSEPIGYVSFRKQPTLLHGIYHDISEAAEAMRNELGGLLLDNFDYHGNLCLICGTYYG